MGVLQRASHPGLLPENGADCPVFTPSPTDQTVRALLTWLSDLDRRGGGYELRGVRGWVPANEMPDRLVRHIGGVSKLAERRLVDRENIALPDRATPFWMYRINARGAGVAGSDSPEAVPGPQEAALAPRMIFTDEQWAALLNMRRAKAAATPTRFTTRELGWRTIKEIRESAGVRSRGLQIWPEDVSLLERAGLLEKREAPGVDRARPITFYRVTDVGERVDRLERTVPSQRGDEP